MKSFKKKKMAIMCLVLVVAIIFMYSMPLTATAADWQISKSKKATTLDSNYQTKVTLSLPASEDVKKADADVVLVMDKSAYSDIAGIEKQPMRCLPVLLQAMTSTLNSAS